MSDYSIQIAQLKEKGYSDEKIARFIELNEKAHKVAAQIVDLLNECDPPTMGASLSIACVSFFQAAEAASVGGGAAAKAKMMKSFETVTIDDVPYITN